MRPLLCLLALLEAVALSGCRRKADAIDTAVPPVTPVAEGTETRRAVAPRNGQLPSLAAVDAALARYVEKHGTFPPRLNDLVTAGYLGQIPIAPPGKTLKYDPQRHFVAFVDTGN